jgi:hypothetical protein
VARCDSAGIYSSSIPYTPPVVTGPISTPTTTTPPSIPTTPIYTTTPVFTPTTPVFTPATTSTTKDGSVAGAQPTVTVLRNGAERMLVGGGVMAVMMGVLVFLV